MVSLLVCSYSALIGSFGGYFMSKGLLAVSLVLLALAPEQHIYESLREDILRAKVCTRVYTVVYRWVYYCVHTCILLPPR